MTIDRGVTPTSISANVEVTKLCGLRDHAIERMKKAVSLMQVAHTYAMEALEASREAARSAGGKEHVFHRNDRRQDQSYKRLFEGIDSEKSLATFTYDVDASIWMRVLEDSGMQRLMDAQAREEFFQQLETSPPAVTEENIDSALSGLREDAHLIFQRGIANVFTQLDRRFKSHDAFQLDSRIILTRMFNEYGSFQYYGKERQMLVDVERVFAVLDGEDPEGANLVAQITQQRQNFHGMQQSLTESRYLRVRGFKNGNAHLWFTRPDLVEKVNLELARYYGAVLPDGVAKEDPMPKSGLPAKDLSFYATPPAVAKELLRDRLYWPEDRVIRILEPSAGVGGICHVILDEMSRVNAERKAHYKPLPPVRYSIDAVEIEPTRAAQLRRIQGISVYQENFLRMSPRPVYDLIVMNPPFYGTHWMEHVQHAYAFLAPKGVLRTVLPITAALGETKQHIAFREWARTRAIGHWNKEEVYFQDLPPESFASSGTRVQTCILTLGAKS